MNNKTVKGILVDPYTQSLSYVDVPVEGKSSTLKGLYSAIGCSLVELISINSTTDLWVDEEGLLKVDENSRFFFIEINGRRSNALAGRGVILGCTHTYDGVICDNVSMTTEEASKIVLFSNFLTL